jgi:hypothetical protein
LIQHPLLKRAEHHNWSTVVAHIGGVQAQVASAAKLMRWAHVPHDLAPADVHHALWRDRTLVKTWAMRDTLHLLIMQDFFTDIAVRQAGLRIMA